MYEKRDDFNFSNTKSTDRLRRVSYSDSSHPIGVVNTKFKGATFSLPQPLYNPKDKHLKIRVFKIKPGGNHH